MRQGSSGTSQKVSFTESGMICTLCSTLIINPKPRMSQTFPSIYFISKLENYCSFYRSNKTANSSIWNGSFQQMISPNLYSSLMTALTSWQSMWPRQKEMALKVPPSPRPSTNPSQSYFLPCPYRTLQQLKRYRHSQESKWLMLREKAVSERAWACDRRLGIRRVSTIRHN